MDWNDKVVIIAGASGALGALFAKKLDERGARLVLAGRDTERLQNLEHDLARSTTASFDLRTSPTTPVEVAMSTFGRIDGLINAAGVVAFGPLEATPNEIIEETIATNLVGPLQLIGAASRNMASGFIVSVTGVVAEQPVAGMTTYVASKAGLSVASAALARELRRKGILLVDARPPHTETGLAGRSIFGDAPQLPAGLEPSRVVDVIIESIEAGEREIPAARFTERTDTTSEGPDEN